MSPAGVVGAVTAMHDAVILANWLSTLRLPIERDLERVFKEYRSERYSVAKANFEPSQLFIRNLGKVKSTKERDHAQHNVCDFFKRWIPSF